MKGKKSKTIILCGGVKFNEICFLVLIKQNIFDEKGISQILTRHHALPVPPRAVQDAVRPAQQLLNLIAAGIVIRVLTTQL